MAIKKGPLMTIPPEPPYHHMEVNPIRANLGDIVWNRYIAGMLRWEDFEQFLQEHSAFVSSHTDKLEARFKKFWKEGESYCAEFRTGYRQRIQLITSTTGEGLQTYARKVGY